MHPYGLQMTSDKPALTASTEWPERVYELQKTDPVDAGADGIDNLAPNQLAARTNYLRVKGISDWAAVWNYPNGAFCQEAGVVYRAVTANAGKPPASNPSAWVKCPMTKDEIIADVNLGSYATTAQMNTGLSSKQNTDATLTALANLTTAADQIPYATGADTFAMTPLTPFARTLLDDANAAAALSTLGAAPVVSPALTGTPTAPTATATVRTQQISTCEFTHNAIDLDRPYEAAAINIKMNGAQSVGLLNTVARGDHVHPTDTSRAPLASPALTGIPTAPTPALGTNSTQIATMAAVQAELSAQKYVSGDLVIANSAQITINHGLGVEPTHISLYMRCAVAELGYAVGDVIRIAGDSDQNGSNEAIGMIVNSTQIVLRIGEAGPQMITRKDTGAGAAATASRWFLIVKATK